jgi:hypothetical protein
MDAKKTRLHAAVVIISLVENIPPVACFVGLLLSLPYPYSPSGALGLGGGG